MKLEMTTLRLTCERPLSTDDARLLRGFFGHRYRSRPEFHHHGPEGLIYRHPLIQYKVIGGIGRIMGVAAGSFLLQALDPPRILSLDSESVEVLEIQRTTDATHFGPCREFVRYRFLTPWLALNEKNYQMYRQIEGQKQRRKLLGKVLIGNLLSLCKSVEVTVEERLCAQVDMNDTEKVEIKKGVALIGVRGSFSVNFLLPEMWGIGKQSARGFGTVHNIEE